MEPARRAGRRIEDGSLEEIERTRAYQLEDDRRAIPARKGVSCGPSREALRGPRVWALWTAGIGVARPEARGVAPALAMLLSAAVPATLTARWATDPPARPVSPAALVAGWRGPEVARLTRYLAWTEAGDIDALWAAGSPLPGSGVRQVDWTVQTDLDGRFAGVDVTVDRPGFHRPLPSWPDAGVWLVVLGRTVVTGGVLAAGVHVALRARRKPGRP